MERSEGIRPHPENNQKMPINKLLPGLIPAEKFSAMAAMPLREIGFDSRIIFEFAKHDKLNLGDVLGMSVEELSRLRIGPGMLRKTALQLQDVLGLPEEELPKGAIAGILIPTVEEARKRRARMRRRGSQT